MPMQVDVLMPVKLEHILFDEYRQPMDMIVFALQCQFVSIDHHYRNTLHDETMHRI